MNTRIVNVTPVLASIWLKKNQNNRKLRAHYVERLAGDMASGRWVPNHQGIAFNANGKLLDGQHRLSAIMKSGKPQPMLVTTGLANKSVATIDDHFRRSAADTLNIVHGIKSTNINRNVAAAAHMVRGMVNTPVKATRSQQAETYIAHRQAIEWVASKFNVTRKGLCRAPVLAVLARAYYTANKAELVKFCDVLRTGKTNAKRDESVIRFRDWLMTAPSAGCSFQHEAYCKTEAVLNAFLRKERLTKIYGASKELFPIPEK